MKNTLIFFLILFSFSCNNQHKNDIRINKLLNVKKYKEVVLFPDSTNYKAYEIENGLIKAIRYYPGTTNPTIIYFFDKNSELKDSTSYYFNKKGVLTKTISYEDSMKIRKVVNYFPDGNIKKKWSVINDILQGDMIFYYGNGQIHNIKEYIILNGRSYLNNEIVYFQNGEINRDSTYYVNLVTKKDTVSINDSLLIRLKVMIPEFTKGRSIIGEFDKNFNPSDENSFDYFGGKEFYFKPKKLGNNQFRLVFETNVNPEKKPEDMILYITYLKKEIFVTE